MKVKSKIIFSKEDMDAFKRVHDIMEKLADTSLNDEEMFVFRDADEEFYCSYCEGHFDELMFALSDFVECSSLTIEEDLD